jgi:cobalt/nickel transport system ATP-binding protein
MHPHEPLIKLEGIAYNYPGGAPVLEDLSFTLARHDRIGIVAPNGSGKTTLLHLIMGLLAPTAGTLELFSRTMRTEKDFREVRRKVGLLFQDADDQLFSPTVLEDVAFGPLNMGKSKAEALALSRNTLAHLGLADFEEKITFKLSGGEKRLVALATVLAMQPQVLLLDEPTAGLDQDTKKRLIQILSELDLAYILISHEFDFLTATTDHMYTMEHGRILVDEELHVHVHEHAHKVGAHPHRHV